MDGVTDSPPPSSTTHSASSNYLRFGVLGTASIARKNVRAIQMSPLCKLVAVASRDLDKAILFAKENRINLEECQLYGSYAELLVDPSVDAVYIPLPTSLHMEWVTKAAIAKKHILIEKPVAVTLAELQQMLQTCADNNVTLIDGVMFMHHKRLASMLRTIRDPLTGPVHRVNSSNSFKGGPEFFADDIRVKASGDPLGALGDLGWYCIRIGLLVFLGVNPEDLVQQSVRKYTRMPRVCIARCNTWTDEGVPLDVECKVGFSAASDDEKYNDDPFAYSLTFDSSFLVPFRQSVEMISHGDGRNYGDKILSCDDFVIPRVPSSASYKLETHPVGGPFGDLGCRVLTALEVMTVGACDQEVEMFSTMARLVAGQRNNHRFWIEMTCITQAVIEACLSSMKADGAMVTVESIESFIPS